MISNRLGSILVYRST